ncbi:MAG: acyl carrier protein [Bacteroidetes bacterium]|nr:acyl carrier protein [Bacteroidota bacterium]
MELNDFLRKFEYAIEDVEPNSVDADLDFQNNLEQWDSLAAMTLLAMIDNEYDVVLTGEELISCKTVNELFELIKSKSNK